MARLEGRIAVVTGAGRGIGAEIAGILMETEAFDYLDAPMERIAGADIPMPYSWAIEGQAVP